MAERIIIKTSDGETHISDAGEHGLAILKSQIEGSGLQIIEILHGTPSRPAGWGFTPGPSRPQSEVPRKEESE